MKDKLKSFFGGLKKQPQKKKTAKRESEKSTNIIYIVPHALISKLKEVNFLVERNVKAKAKVFAEKNLPVPDETVAPPIEKWVRAKYQALVHLDASIIFGHTAKMFNIFYFKKDDLKLLFKDPQRYYEILKQRVAEKWDKALEALSKKFADKTDWLNEKIKTLKEKIEAIKSEMLELSKELEIKPSIKKLHLVKPVYHIWISIIAIADIVAIATALSVMRENVIFTFSLTTGIALSLLVSSDLSGIMLKSYHLKKERRKLIIPLVVALFSFLITVFLGEARIFYLSQNDEVEFPALIRYGFTALNFFFYCVSLFASYRLHYKNLPKAKERNLLYAKRIKSEKELEKLVKQSSKIEQEGMLEEKELNETFQTEIDMLDNKEFELRSDIAELTNEIDMAKVAFTEHFGIINQNYKEKVQKFRTVNHLFRSDKKTCKYWKDEVLDLAFDFEDYGFVYPFKGNVLNEKTNYKDYNNEILDDKKSVAQTEIKIDLANEEENPKRNSKPRNLPVIFDFPVVVFALIFSLFIMGCNQPEPVNTSVMTIIDKTPDAKSDIYKITAEDILDIMQIGEKKRSVNYGDFSLTTINNISRNVYKTTSLEKGSWIDNKSVRKEKLKTFKNETQEYIEEAYVSNVRYEHSKIYIALCEASELLVAKKSERKVLIILSDMIENSRVSFYDDFENQIPYGVLITDLEYEEILPNLVGVEIIIVFNTDNPQLDDLVRKVQKFWKFFLEDKGAKVRFKANL